MKIVSTILIFILVLSAVLAAVLVYVSALPEPVSPTAFKSSSAHLVALEAMQGESAKPKPLPFSIPAHPFMARQGFNAMHADGYSSDVHLKGPLGVNPQVNTRRGNRLPGSQCATLTFDSEHRLLMLCAGLSGFRIHLLEPRTLKLLAEYKLPMRPSTFDALFNVDLSYMMEDSSGAYFYLDNKNRIVMAASDQTVRRIKHQQDKNGNWFFTTEDLWDLSKQVPHDCAALFNPKPEGECDPITAVMPDYQGFIWWVTRKGRLGTLNPETGQVQGIRLQNEEIQNGFSVAKDGVYIVSDHKLYRFYTNESGTPVIGWSEKYDRGTHRKVGTINQGSGTTPTLLGDEFVTITDNADGRMNVLVFHRQQDFQGDRLICSVPLFEEGHSVTDNSMIGINRSIILENNAGYQNAFYQNEWNKAGGGISRIDIKEDNSGCEIVWHSDVKSPSVVPKLAAETGLAYFYSFETQGSGENAWYLTALDFESGKTRFKILTGLGRNFDNNWSPLTLGPDGTAYIGTFGGVIAVWDATE